MVIQARARTYQGAGEAEGPRVGFTITKKVGNAVVRNRIRRRLKAAVAALAVDALRLDHDYVVIAKRDALLAPFDVLKADLARGLAKAHAGRPKGRGRKARSTSEDGGGGEANEGGVAGTGADRQGPLRGAETRR